MEHLALGVGIGVVIGWFLREIRIKKKLGLRNSSPKLSDAEEQYKMVIVVRNDLKMGKGKAAAQCTHGALEAAEKAMMKDSESSYGWKACGQPKVVVKTDSEQSLLLLARKASESGLIFSVIRDVGRTQLGRGSKTALAVGPGPASLVDKVTGHLKLH